MINHIRRRSSTGSRAVSALGLVTNAEDPIGDPASRRLPRQDHRPAPDPAPPSGSRRRPARARLLTTRKQTARTAGTVAIIANVTKTSATSPPMFTHFDAYWD